MNGYDRSSKNRWNSDSGELMQAELLLTDTKYSVGIQTQSYFSKAINHEFGKTPTQYLKELEAKK